MTSLPLPSSFIDTVAAVQRVLDAFAQQGVIIGGVAASLLGKPRTTADVNAVILLSIDELPQLLTVAEQEGLLPRTDNAEAFARRHRVLRIGRRMASTRHRRGIACWPIAGCNR